MSCFIDKNNIENFKEVIGLFAASKINELVNDGKTIELDALSKAVYDFFKEQGLDEALAQDAGAALPFIVNDLMKVNEFVELIKKVNPKIRSEVGAKIESYEEDINNVKKDLGISTDLAQQLNAAQEIAATTIAQEAEDEAFEKVFFSRKGIYTTETALATKGQEQLREGDAFTNVRNPIMRAYYKLQRSILSLLRLNSALTDVVYPGIGKIYLKYAAGSMIPTGQRVDDTFAKSAAFNTSMVGIITDEKGNHLFINENGELVKEGTKLAYYSVSVPNTKKKDNDVLSKMQAYVLREPEKNFVINHITGGSFGYIADRVQIPLSQLKEKYTISEFNASGDAVVMPESITETGEGIKVERKKLDESFINNVTNLFLNKVYEKKVSGEVVELSQEEKENLLTPFINIDKIKISRESGDISLKAKIRELVRDLNNANRSEFKSQLGSLLANFNYNINKEFVGKSYNDFNVSQVEDKMMLVSEIKDYTNDYINTFKIKYAVDSEGKAGLFNSYFSFQPLKSQAVKYEPDAVAEVQEAIVEGEKLAQEAAPVNKGITNEGPADALSTKQKIMKSFDDRGMFKKRAGVKAINRDEVQAKIDEAYEWYMKSPLRQHFPFEVMVAAVNSEDRNTTANWTTNGIILFHHYNADGTLDKSKSADYTDLYHESWHGFTQTFLNKKQRAELYKEISKQPGSFRDYNGNLVTFANADYLQLEEFLAEDFRKYMLSGGKTDLKSTPVKNSIFSKILEFLKSLFGKATVMDVAQSKETGSFPAVIELYNKLRVGDLSGFTFDVNNRDQTVGQLRSTVQKTTDNIADDNLNYQDSQVAINLFDSIISQLTDALNTERNFKSFSVNLLKSPENLKAAYQYVKEVLVSDERPALLAKKEAAVSQDEKDRIQKSIDLIDYCIRNFGNTEDLKKNIDGKGLIAYHQMKSKYISYEDRADFFEELDEEGASQKGGSNFDKGGNEKSAEQYADPDIHSLLRSLYKFDKDNQPVNIGLFNIRELTPYTESWNKVARILSGTIDENSMEAKLIEAAKTDGTIAHLLEKLGPLDVTYPKEFQLWSKFWQTFNLVKIELIQMNVEEQIDSNKVSNYTIKIGRASSSYRKIGILWNNGIKAITATKDGYIKRDSNLNDNYIDVNKVIKDFADKNGKLDPNKAIAFYNAIGITLSDASIQALANDKKAGYIFSHLKQINQQRGISQIYDLAELFKEYPEDAPNKRPKIDSQEGNYTFLQELEARNSDYINNFSVTNAEGNTQYEHSLNNTLSIQANAINSASSYQELMRFPYMQHLNKDKNPWIKSSVWMNSIFDMKTGAKRPGVKINLNNLSGVQFITDDGNSTGISSASADEFTKFIQDFHLSSIAGKPELMRHADKSTSFSMYINKLNTGSKKNLYIDPIEFTKRNGKAGYEKAYKEFIKNYIGSELERINKFKALAKQKNLEMDFDFLREGQNFVVFEDFLTDDTKVKLLAQEPGLSMDEIFELDPELQKAVYKDYTNYFDRQIADVTKMFADRDFISASYLKGIQTEGNVKLEEARKAALSAFVFNSWINNLESMSVIYGDIAQYNIAKEEFHKRNAGAGSTGTIFRSSALAINFVNADERLYEKYMKRKGIIPVTKERRMMSLDGELNTAVVEDVKLGTEYIKEIEAAIAEDVKNTYKGKKLSKAEINDKIEKAIGDYRDSMKEGDGQGWLTFDSYRALSKLNSNWTDEQEELYTRIANGEKIPTGKAMQFFPVRKFQYFGTLKNDHVAMTAFHKFSLMPLIPNVIEGKKLEQLHIKMMNEDIDYALFKSGSKVATVTKDGVENKFYTNTEDRTIVNISDAPFTKNVVYLQFLKNQLEIAPEFKGKTTFPTQMRKLIENGLMEGGVPIDFQRTKDLDTRIANWAKVKDKEAASDVYKLVKKYEAHVAELTEILKEDLIEQADLRFDADNNVIFSEKLRDFLVKEMERQDLADHEIDFVKYMGTNIARDLSLSLSAEKLEKVLNSIVVNRLVRQKFTGEGLVQVSTAGFEDIIPKFKNATEADKLKYNGTNDLPFYGRGKGKNGKTSATKIKIAMQGDFLKLLQLKHPDGKKIGTIARLNELITQDEWLDTGDNRSMVTLVGARIPVQGTNSMEFMEVYEFLEESAGNIIILPSEIVVKSGGDFDIDKLTVMMPNIHLINGEPRIIKPKVVKKGTRPQLKAAFTKELNELYEQRDKIEDSYEAEYEALKDADEFKKLTKEEKDALDASYNEYASQRKELRDQIKELRPQWTKLFNKKISDVYTPEDFERVDYDLSRLLDDLEIAKNNWNDTKFLYKSTFKSEKVKQFWATQDALLKPILDRVAIVKTDLAGISPKAYQNAIISDMREILEMPENYLALVKPNSTYILKDEIADKIADDVQDYDPKYRINGPVQKKIAGTRIFEVGYNLYKHKSNNVGKQVLGMFAVGNTYNSIFNRIGMKLNYSMVVGFGKNAFTKTLGLSLNHNKLKDSEGRSVVSLSHLKDANNEFNIADMISQLINGAVDVARDSWLFNIQGNKEVGPTLEFLLEAGVPAKQAVYFVSQPIIREYVELQRKARSPSARPLGEDIANPNFYRNYARDKMIDQHVDELWGMYQTLKPGQKKLAINNITTDLKNTQEFNDFISGDNAEKNLRDTLSKGINIDESGYTSDRDKAMLLHFFEIEDMAKTIRDVKLRTNFDTTRSASTYEAEDKIILADDLAANQMIPSNVLELIKTQTPIGSFFVQEFQIKAWKNFFDLRNNDTLNLFIRNYIQKNRSKIDDTYENVGEFIKDFKNNINSFIFQNELKAFNIDDVTSYKGLSVKNGQYIKGIEPTLRLRSGVAIKQVDGKIAVYVDKAQLQFDLTNLATIAADPIVKDGVVVSRPAKVNKDAFTDRAGANNYYRFVIEREILRHIYSPKDLETRKDYQNMLANNLANPKYKITTETAELYNERIKALTYEQLLRDMALDNTYNSWKMFQSKDASFASQFIQLLRDYPELKDYDVIKNLSINESKDKKIKNLVFADSLMTGDRLNVFNENFVELANASNIKINATDQERRRVAEFFDKMSMYAFLQSGMNTTGQLSLIRAVPQNRFLAVMIPAAANFLENINYNTLDQYAELLFKNQADFRTRNRMSNYQLAKYDMVTDKKLAAQGVVTSRERNRVAEPLEKDNMGNLLYDTEVPELDDKGEVKKDNNKKVITRSIYAEEARQILKDNPNDIIIHDTTTAARPSSKKGQYAFYDTAKVSGNTLALPIMHTSTEAYADQTKEDISKGKEGVRPVEKVLSPADILEASKNQKKLNSLKLFIFNYKQSKVLTPGEKVEVYFNKSDSTNVLTIDSINKVNDMFKVTLKNNSGKTYTYTVDKSGKSSSVEIEPDNKLLVFEKDIPAYNKAVAEYKKLKQIEQPFIQGKLSAPTIGNLEKYTIDLLQDDQSKITTENEGYRLIFKDHPNAVFYLKVVMFDDQPAGWVVENVNTGYRASNMKDTAEEAYKDFMSKLFTLVQDVDISNENAVRVITVGGLDIEKLKPGTTQSSTSVKTGIEINSKETGLGNSLTNVHYAKDGKSAFDIVPTDKTLSNPITGRGLKGKSALETWGNSVEAWYQSNNAQTKGVPEGVEGDAYDMKLMVGLITDKLNQYPNLVQQINASGGIEFLNKSTHTMGNGRWSSNNPKNMFMNALKQAYQTVAPTTQSSTSVKPSTKILSVPVVNATAKKNIDAFIEQAKLLKAEGKNLAFPKSGLGQEMRKTIKGKTSPSHQTFLYLSERLLELGYLNPGFVKSLSDPQDQTSKTGYKIVQEFQEVSDNEASDNLLNCKNI